MVAPLLFLISIASLTHLLYLFCSVPMTLTLSHPMTWFCSTTLMWSVTADLWTVDSDSFLLALVNTDLLTLSTSVLCSFNRVPNLRPVSPMYSRFIHGRLYRGIRGIIRGQYFLSHVYAELLLEKSLKKRKHQLATPNQPHSADRLVLEVAVSSSVDKEGRCPQNVLSK